MNRIIFIIIIFLLFLNVNNIFNSLEARSSNNDNSLKNLIHLNVLQYESGDWYEALQGLKNLITFVNQNTPLNVAEEFEPVRANSFKLKTTLFLYMTGHTNVILNDQELDSLRQYLMNGGFLYVDDDYGLDKSFRPLVKRLFPSQNLVRLPNKHSIFNIYYQFPNGTPKIHKHDEKPPETYALYYKNRIVILYTYESNIADGWASYRIHQTPEKVRQQALKFGANILIYASTH